MVYFTSHAFLPLFPPPPLPFHCSQLRDLPLCPHPPPLRPGIPLAALAHKEGPGTGAARGDQEARPRALRGRARRHALRRRLLQVVPVGPGARRWALSAGHRGFRARRQEGRQGLDHLQQLPGRQGPGPANRRSGGAGARVEAPSASHGRQVRERGSVLPLRLFFSSRLFPHPLGPPPSSKTTKKNSSLAESFAPERFLGGAGGERGAGSEEPTGGVATFGFANHFCLGAPLYSMEARALVATLVRGYEIGTADGGEPMRWASSWAATSRSGQRVQVRVEKRKEPL